NLTHPLARHPEPASDLPERLRLAFADAVTEDQHRPLAVLQARECLRQRLVPERVLDLFLGSWVVAGHEVGKDGVVLLPDRLIQADAGPCGAAHLTALAEGQVCLL